MLRQSWRGKHIIITENIIIIRQKVTCTMDVGPYLYSVRSHLYVPLLDALQRRRVRHNATYVPAGGHLRIRD